MELPVSGLNKNNGQIVNDTFYCSFLGCKYNIHFGESVKSFKNQKLLKQHCIKVHFEKKYKCGSCEKGFALESTLRSHRIKCGVTFTCYCGIKYNSPEAFLTHSKRKNHDNGLRYSAIMKVLKTRTLLPNTEHFQALEYSKIPTQTQSATDVQTLSNSSTHTTFENKDCMLRYNDSTFFSAASSPITQLCEQTQTGPVFMGSETQNNFDFLDIHTETAEFESIFYDLQFINNQT